MLQLSAAALVLSSRFTTYRGIAHVLNAERCRVQLELVADDYVAEVFGNDSTQYCEMFKCTAGERGSQWEIETLSVSMPLDADELN